MAFNHQNDLISRVYTQYHAQLTGYIRRMVNDADDADDIAQEAFINLMGYGEKLQETTVKSLLFRIAGNLVNDYLRHLYVKTEVHTQLGKQRSEESDDTESGIYARDLRQLERRKLASMPGQRRVVYMLRIHGEKNTQEVADALNISRRTAENHFYLGLKEMREYFRACI